MAALGDFSHIGDLVRDKDVADLKREIDWYFDIDLPITVVEAWLPRARNSGHDEWSTGSWMAWWKLRIPEKVFRWKCPPHREAQGFTCLMHVCFLWIEETQEQLANLRSDDAKPIDPRPVRSKISQTQLNRINPIDRVAHRVAKPS